LREELNFFDYCFKTNSNTEPIIKAYQHWGLNTCPMQIRILNCTILKEKQFKETIGLKLPWAILHAPKRGFVVPIREWFKEDSFTEILYNFEKTIPYLNKNKISKIAKMNQNVEEDYGNFIWMLLTCYKKLSKMK